MAKYLAMAKNVAYICLVNEYKSMLAKDKRKYPKYGKC
jgi:hypothetical protein